LGHGSVGDAVPFLQRMLAPTWWEGDGPARERIEVTPYRAAASTMGEILEGMAAVPRNAVQRFRDRRFT